MEVVPDPTARPGDTYTITVMRNGVTTVIADHALVQDIPVEPYEVTLHRPVDLAIDVIPFDDANVLAGTPRKLPVALLSSPTVDAVAEVDRDSLTFGSTGHEPTWRFCDPDGRDVNGDGRADLICHFNTAATDFKRSESIGTLRGQMLNGARLTGTDSIRVVP